MSRASPSRIRASIPTASEKHCYDDGNYDGFADPWEDDIIHEGAEEWRKASALMDAVSRLTDWLEEDLPGRFAEMLGFVLERLPNQEQEDNDDE